MDKQIEIYKKNAQPPEWALKVIQGGRTKGMTDINPQWRITALTETFGLCGIGWKIEIKNKWLEYKTEEVSCFVEINLFIKHENSWSEPIPAIGGSSFITKEKTGLYQSDECFKMAYTDAISVACKLIGIAGNVYSGSKYSQILAQENELELIFKLIENCNSREALSEIWNKNNHLQKNELFINKIKEIGNKFNTK